MESPHPRRILAGDREHPIDVRLALGSVVDVLHLQEQPVVFGILVVRGVLATGLRARLRAVQQEHEVLGVGVVSVAAEEEELRNARAVLLLASVPVPSEALWMGESVGVLYD